MSEFVRARQESTGHVAALPAAALGIGACPGWAAIDGPAPAGPKVNAGFAATRGSAEAAESRDGEQLSTEDTRGSESLGSSKSADSASAEKKE